MEHQRSLHTHLALIYKMRLTIAFIVSNHTHRAQLPINQLANENRNPQSVFALLPSSFAGLCRGEKGWDHLLHLFSTKLQQTSSLSSCGGSLMLSRNVLFALCLHTFMCIIDLFFLQNAPRESTKVLSSVLRARRGWHIRKRVRWNMRVLLLGEFGVSNVYQMRRL